MLASSDPHSHPGGWSALLFASVVAGCGSAQTCPPGTASRAGASGASMAAPPDDSGEGEPERPVTAPSSLVLEYHRAARDWERDALPIGNGRLGAMIMGPPSHAQFQFNEASLWTGNDNPTGQFDEHGFGNYQAFGELAIELAGLGSVRDYVRRLDLATALHTTSFTGADGTRYLERAFASHPAQVIAIRLEADGASALTGSVRLAGAHAEQGRGTSPGRLMFEGALPNGLAYRAEVAVLAEGGSLTSSGTALDFSGCRTLTLYLGARTSYAIDSVHGFRGAPPAPDLEAELARALGSSFQALLDTHVRDHQRLFARVALDLGKSSDEVRSRTTDARVTNYQPGADPELMATLFQYGRYLLIASSRPGGLPANLQGIWNHSNQPPWHADYHTNINVQMNYWLAEPANLSECHLPLFDLLDAMLPSARTATRASFGDATPGFTYRTSHNIFGGQGWEWNTPASAWYATHYFEHYAFTRDLEFLRWRAWPYLKEASEFWLHRLKRREDGALVAPDGWSPEHGPREDGVSYDQELVGELFTDALEAGAALGLSDPILARIAEAKRHLLRPKIGKWGQLQEWTTDRDDPDDHHRHTSHLVGIYPGRQISVTRTPELAKAAEVSLRARGDTGDSRRSWTWPWRCALWARLRTPECHRMLDGYVAYNLLPNLISNHPPLQLDGSYGITAGIAEMLIQSHAGEIHLLPGVGSARWPSGSFQGLRARGAFELSARWQDGRLREAELLSFAGNPAELRAEPAVARVTDSHGGLVKTMHTPAGTVRFATRTGERYRIQFE